MTTDTRTFTQTTSLIDILNWAPTTLDTSLAQHLLADAWAALIAQYGSELHELSHSTDIAVGATQLQVSITFDEPVLHPPAYFHSKPNIQA